jgi:C-terminal processing protease CtpA/Prc
MKRAALFMVVLLLLLQTASVSAQPQNQLVLPAQQLLAAIKLWGDVRLFDPQASDGSVDWDAAFMNAEPAILGATSKESYSAAIAALLAPLHDPATYVSSSPPPTTESLTLSSIGSVAAITLPHNVSSDQVQAQAPKVFTAAAKSHYVLFDLRGVTEANGNDVASLGYLFSTNDDDAAIAALLKGDVSQPRGRSRTYDGFPNQAAGYIGYSASDQDSDAVPLHGKSQEAHRLGFLVDGVTSLPPLAIALTLTGDATIFTTGGQPSALSTGGAVMDLPYQVRVTFRTGDLADFATQQRFATINVHDPQDAAAQLASQTPPAPHYERPLPDQFVENPYPSALFPNEGMRMLAIARIYNIIRYFSPYTALMHDDWDAAALQAIGDERAASNARAYVLGLMRFYAHLHDSHGFVVNKTIRAEFGARLPFSARYLHGQAVVTDLYASGDALHGLRAGDIIETVDGVPVRTAMNRIERYISASTPQSADYAALNRMPSIFAGPKGSSVTLQFRQPGSQTTTTVTFVRDFLPARPPSKSPKFFILPGNVGYVAFDRLEVSEVDAMFAALKNTRAIVFDNRGYPLGAAWPIAPRLTTATSVRLALFNTPQIIAPLDVDSDSVAIWPTYLQFYQMMDRAAGPRYLKPTVMLLDERTISQAEHSALFFREAGQTRFVGAPTQGANGDVTTMVAPGAVYLNFSGEGVRHVDGSQLQRVGILPDVRVSPAASDIATGNDVVLQSGLNEALRLTGASPSLRKAAVRQEIAREHAAAARP